VGPTFIVDAATNEQAAAIEVDASGRIVATHKSRDGLRGRARVVVLPGKLATPGLHDAHLHIIAIGRAKERVNLRGATSVAEVKRRIAAFAKANPKVAFITGRGWDQSLWGGTFPTWRDIEGATDKPVLVRRVDGHAALANRVMMQRAAIAADTETPDGGEILRDKSGAPTGVFVDRAMELVRAKVPEPTHRDRRRWLRMGAEACASGGLVTVHDMGSSVQAVNAMVAEDRSRPLPVRVFVYLDGDDEQALPWLRAHKASARSLSPRVTVMGVKLFADGAMGSRGAALLEAYSDRPESKGTIIIPVDKLNETVAQIHATKAQVAIHAIGDRGNRVALDAIVLAQGEPKNGNGLRHRVEHAQLLHPDDLRRFAKHGITASMQPTHATSDMRWAEKRVGPVRLRGAYAWKTLLNTGAKLALGSDAPVESEKVLWGLHAVTTRTDHAGKPVGGWQAHEILTDSEALAGFSSGAAWAIHREQDLGTLRPGMRFDVSVFDRDPRGRKGQWLKAKALVTFVDGRRIDHTESK